MYVKIFYKKHLNIFFYSKCFTLLCPHQPALIRPNRVNLVAGGHIRLRIAKAGFKKVTN